MQPKFSKSYGSDCWWEAASPVPKQLYLVDGLNIEHIGKLYQVHRATVARWISSARDQLYGETRQRLREELALNATEFESIVRLVRSQLDISVRRILQEAANKGNAEPDPGR